MNSRYSLFSIMLAFAIGVAIAWMAVPGPPGVDPALEKIVDDDADVRRNGWLALETNNAIAPHLDRINGRLEAASDNALRDAADHLRATGLWDWEHQPAELVLREAKLRAAGDGADREIAAQQMATCPLDLDVTDVMPVLWQLLHEAEGRQLERGMEVAFGWIGPHRFQQLRGLPILADEDTRRMVRLALYWARDRHYLKPVTRAWAPFNAEAAMTHLRRNVADDDGMVYAAALLAEHSLPREQAVELAAKWIVDFNDDRKRAGALLAALLGEHAELLGEALGVATEPLVRTTLRLALLALGEPVGEDGDREFAHRTLHLPGGHINPDVLFCLLVAGHEDAPRLLASTPVEPTGEALQARNLLIERFAPFWNIHAAVEDGPDPVLAYYEAMRAVWMLTHRWMAFDDEQKQWRVLSSE